jgi:hypothetical protein
MSKTTITVLIVGLIVGFGVGFWSGKSVSTNGNISGSTGASEEELLQFPGETLLDNVKEGLNTGGRLAGDPIIATEVKLAKSGYVVVHEDKDGEPGAVIGVSDLLTKGLTKEVEIKLDRPSVVGETLWVMLHTDDGDGEFEFPGSDTPLVDEKGEAIVKPIVIK